MPAIGYRQWWPHPAPHGPEHDCLLCAEARRDLGRVPVVPLLARRSMRNEGPQKVPGWVISHLRRGRIR